MFLVSLIGIVLNCFVAMRVDKPTLRHRPRRNLNLSAENGELEAPISTVSDGLDHGESETLMSNTRAESQTQGEFSLQGRGSAEGAGEATGLPGSHSISLSLPQTLRVSKELRVLGRSNRQKIIGGEPCPGTSGEHLGGPTVSPRDQEPIRAEFEGNSDSEGFGDSSSDEEPEVQPNELIVGAISKKPLVSEKSTKSSKGSSKSSTSNSSLRLCRRKEVSAPHFDGQGLAFPDFLTEFGLVAQFNRWGEEEKCFHMWHSIQGGARLKILALTYEASWIKLVANLSKVFCSDRAIERYRSKWLDAKRATEMDMDTYAHYLLDLSRKANPLSVPEEQERFAKDKFLETAGSVNMKFWLRALRPQNLQDAIDLASQYESAYESVKPQKPDFALPIVAALSEEPGKESQGQIKGVSDSTQELDVAERICEMVEKLLQKQQPKGPRPFQRPVSKGQGRSKQTKAVSCYHCHQPGHIRRLCPELVDGDEVEQPKRGYKRPASDRAPLESNKKARQEF